MARPGITEEQVFEAAEQLQKEGIAITANAIRERIGAGSYTTIKVMLVKWRESKNNIIPTNTPDMPDTVNLAAQKIWETAWIEALNNIKAEREILGAAWRERELESCEMLNEIKRLETEIEEQKDEIIELNTYLEERHSDRVELRRANKELEKENSELDQELKNAIKRVDDVFEELKILNFNICSSSKPIFDLQKDSNGFIINPDEYYKSPGPSRLTQLQLDNHKAENLVFLKNQKKEFPEMSEWTPKFEQDSAI